MTDELTSVGARARRMLVAGALVGIALSVLLRFLGGTGTGLMTRVLAVGILAVVPLVLAILPSTGPRWDMTLRVAAFTHPLVGAAAVLSLWLPGGEAGVWTAPWMAFTLIVAGLGALRLWEGTGAEGNSTALALAEAAALLFLPVGGFWLSASRFGVQPLGFDPVIVTLTAVHFHFAAIATPVLIGRVARGCPAGGRSRRLATAAALGVVVGVPTVALGLTFSPLIALVGALLMTLALLTYGAIALVVVRPTLKRRAARVLLSISGLSVFLSMPLALLWAWGEVTTQWLELGAMIRLHGFANAHGVIVCGLLAFSLASQPSDFIEDVQKTASC